MEIKQAIEHVIKKVDHVVENYRKDFQHDRDLCEKFADTKHVTFIHYARENGTHMIMMPPHDSKHYPPKGKDVPYLFGRADREHLLQNGIVGMAEYFERNQTEYTVHYYDGHVIHEIDHIRATRITKQYAGRIKDAWRVKDSYAF